MRVSAAVIVVDVSRGQQAPRGRGLRAEIGRDMGMTGIERQGQAGPIELAKKLEQFAHQAAGMDAGRHVLDADDHPASLGMVSQLGQSARQAGAPRGPIIDRRKGSGMNHEEGSSCLLKPIDASFQIVGRLAVHGGLAQIDPGCLDGPPAPAAVSAVDRQTAISHSLTHNSGIWQSPPVGQDFQDFRAQPLSQVKLGVQAKARVTVSDHGAEQPSRHVFCP